MRLTRELLKKMVASIAMTKEHELTCDECFEEIDKFAELKLAGKNPAEALPLVQDHLDRCKSCNEEFEALLDAIQSIS